MRAVKVFEAKTLIESMEDRSQNYNDLREKLQHLKKKFTDIVQLDDSLQGKGAAAIKGFYQGQIDVVEAWLRLIDRNIAFFNGISGMTEDVDLSDNTTVYLPFLEDELSHHETSYSAMVTSQQEELQKIVNRIDDLVPLNVFSMDRFNDQLAQAQKKRHSTIQAVESLDADLKTEYMFSENDEYYAVTLFQQLIEATRQGGNTISPIHFNAEAYKSSDVYKLKEQANDYIAYKNKQEEARNLQAKVEAEKKEWDEMNPVQKSVQSFKEMGVDFWDGLEERNKKKLDSLYDFGNYLTVGAFDGSKALYQGMEDRANIAMESPYNFINYVSMGTLDLGNGAINPEESFSKEHWYSSIGLASILAGGAKPVVGGVAKLPRDKVAYKSSETAHYNGHTRIEYLRGKYGKLTSEELHNKINIRGIHEDAINVGSKNTWNEFLNNNSRIGSIEDIKNSYVRLIRDQSPWPEGFSPEKNVLRAGNTFEMVLDIEQPINKPGSFGTFDSIQDIEYAKKNLAIKSNWKKDFGKVVTYRIKDGVELPVLRGPVGPQIDLNSDNYLPGGGTQIQLLVDWKEDKMKYLEVVSVRANN